MNSDSASDNISIEGRACLSGCPNGKAAHSDSVKYGVSVAIRPDPTFVGHIDYQPKNMFAGKLARSNRKRRYIF